MELEKAIETVEILIVENKKEVVLTCIIAGVILLFAIIIETYHGLTTSKPL